MSVSPILVFHISCGVIGLLSGAVAMIFRKGSRGRVLSGRVFVVSMVGLSVAGAYLAVMKSQTGNVIGGVMTFYLVTTAWATARRKDAETDIFDWGTLVVGLVTGTVMTIYGFQQRLAQRA